MAVRRSARSSTSPWAWRVDAAGNVLVADLSNRIRKITPDGIITTVAGSGIAGFAGDGGPATNAQLNHPTGVIVDATGGILIADQHNYRVRRVDPSGTITTVAGTGFPGYRAGGRRACAASGAEPADDARARCAGRHPHRRDGRAARPANRPRRHDLHDRGRQRVRVRRRRQAGHRSEPDQAHRRRRHSRGRRADRRSGGSARPPRRPVGGHPHDRRERRWMSTTGDGGQASAASLSQPDEPARGPLASRPRQRRRMEHPRALDRAGRHDQHGRRWRHSAPANGLLATTAALTSATSMAIDQTGGVIVAVTGLNQLWTLVPARPGI